MQHIDCVKKWPAAYRLMAAVMDDMSISSERGVEVWGERVTQIAIAKNAAPIQESDVKGLMIALWDRLEVAPVPESTQPIKASIQPPVPAGSVGDSSKSAGGARKPSSKEYTKFVGTVVEVASEEKEARFGGGQREVMVVKEHNKNYGLKGTLPAAIKGKVKVGDVVEFKARISRGSTHKYMMKTGATSATTIELGFYSWPKDARIIK